MNNLSITNRDSALCNVIKCMSPSNAILFTQKKRKYNRLLCIPWERDLIDKWKARKYMSECNALYPTENVTLIDVPNECEWVGMTEVFS